MTTRKTVYQNFSPHSSQSSNKLRISYWINIINRHSGSLVFTQNHRTVPEKVLNHSFPANCCFKRFVFIRVDWWMFQSIVVHRQTTADHDACVRPTATADHHVCKPMSTHNLEDVDARRWWDVYTRSSPPLYPICLRGVVDELIEQPRRRPT